MKTNVLESMIKDVFDQYESEVSAIIWLNIRDILKRN